MVIVEGIRTTTRAGAATARNYHAFGLRIRSEVALPLPEREPTAADVRIELAPSSWRPAPEGTLVAETTCDEGCHQGQVIGRVQRGPNGTWIWSHDTGFYHVAPDARTVTIYAEWNADPRALALVVLGQVAIYILHQLGYPSLHASGILVGGGAVVFVAPPGTGKSTMAGCFLRHGATLLTDDVLPLQARGDGIYALPGAPVMKVWSATASNTLGIRTELPRLTAAVDKKLLSLNGRYPFAEAAAPLRAVYLLGRSMDLSDDRLPVHIQQLHQRRALPLLLAQSPRLEMLYPSEAARVLPLYSRLLATVPVRALRVTTGFEHHEVVRRAILTDLGVRPSATGEGLGQSKELLGYVA
jgi:hypothetical protein